MTNLLQKRKSTGNVLTVFAIATFILHLSVLFLFILQGLNIRQLSLRKPPNFVQMIDGEPVGAVDDLARDPEVIRQFISQTMTSMFNWSGTLPQQNVAEVEKPQPDPGIQVTTPQGGRQKVTTSSWVASFAISEDFRKGFLGAIAQMTPPEVFSNNPSQVILAELVIQRIYPPKQIAPGKWQVGMVANLIQKKQDDDRKTVTPFNKDFLVRAVDYFPYPMVNTSTDIQKAIYSNRAKKLEIYEIRNLCLLNDYSSLSEGTSSPCGNEGNSQSFIR
ncbi:hypothetical protein [Umezakia ovalisporum]|jgi:hypothetical protein|uniref:Uncharacterized protein n=2 Tax=Umezakia ovalisporum TaxID=75695 RepID=A0AA43H1F4_9CYAN|nr:hypothetical protein [Umezakia ovalisporum]MBI1242185.1 hypothetical protein [Nostoc sp. RI_552]MDH6056207.1 hypothetical protein [Umezakia ovalisporum FSS-43]MDH6065629.1 hypothetical protein [Umezakia ovalisporum FSS-62]MDH6072100.1 hypothetical protein [Umezakia ovalisporum CobakiLakeA]MDH6073993.1 hypothetical protein [Umezakia ovalisporum CS-1034]